MREPFSMDRVVEMEPYYEVLVGGEPLPDGIFVLDLALTFEKGTAAGLSIQFADVNRLICNEPWILEGSQVSLDLGYKLEFQRVGPFKVTKMEPTVPGVHSEISVEAVAGNGLTDDHVRRVFDRGTVREVFETVAGSFGLTLSASLTVATEMNEELTASGSLVQQGESSAAFLSRIARERGWRMTTEDNRIYVTTIEDDADPGQQPTAFLFRFDATDATMINPKITVETRVSGGRRRAVSRPTQRPEELACPPVQCNCDCSAFGPQPGGSLESLASSVMSLVGVSSEPGAAPLVSLPQAATDALESVVVQYTPPEPEPGSGAPRPAGQSSETTETTLVDDFGRVIAGTAQVVLDMFSVPEEPPPVTGLGISLSPTATYDTGEAVARRAVEYMHNSGLLDQFDVLNDWNQSARAEGRRRTTKFTLEFTAIFGLPWIRPTNRVGVTGIGRAVDSDGFVVRKALTRLSGSSFTTEITCDRVVTENLASPASRAARVNAADVAPNGTLIPTSAAPQTNTGLSQNPGHTSTPASTDTGLQGVPTPRVLVDEFGRVSYSE